MECHVRVSNTAEKSEPGIPSAKLADVGVALRCDTGIFLWRKHLVYLSFHHGSEKWPDCKGNYLDVPGR